MLGFQWRGPSPLLSWLIWPDERVGKISDGDVSSSFGRQSGSNSVNSFKSRCQCSSTGVFPHSKHRVHFVKDAPDPSVDALMNEQSSSFTARGAAVVVASLLLAVGVSVGGSFVGDGIANWNSGRRIIAVKGLSEREVPASVATWSIGYRATGNDLSAINRKLSDSTRAVLAFLKTAGFEEKDVAVQPPALRDVSMEPREKDAPPPPERY